MKGGGEASIFELSVELFSFSSAGVHQGPQEAGRAGRFCQPLSPGEAFDLEALKYVCALVF